MAESFTPVGKADEIPDGDMRSFQVGGEEVAVANVGGAFYAFGDVCTHKGCSLAEGDLDGTTVTCQCHGSQFDVTNGSVIAGPATMPVGSYEVSEEGGELRVGI
jgi:3-phenylpropionate/trans-cinnamate dioxygenase ferredoxin component